MKLPPSALLGEIGQKTNMAKNIFPKYHFHRVPLSPLEMLYISTSLTTSVKAPMPHFQDSVYPGVRGICSKYSTTSSALMQYFNNWQGCMGACQLNTGPCWWLTTH